MNKVTAKVVIRDLFKIFGDNPKMGLEQVRNGVDKADLLEGVSKAVCYSGFRTGQHPDRGDGAVNPSDENIIEDLTILSQANFQLIRLYDSGENSQAVLRVIADYGLDFKPTPC